MTDIHYAYKCVSCKMPCPDKMHHTVRAPTLAINPSSLKLVVPLIACLYSLSCTLFSYKVVKVFAIDLKSFLLSSHKVSTFKMYLSISFVLVLTRNVPIWISVPTTDPRHLRLIMKEWHAPTSNLAALISIWTILHFRGSMLVLHFLQIFFLTLTAACPILKLFLENLKAEVIFFLL